MRQYHQLRDVKAWMESGISLSTPSNEAAKLYDASISQFVGWYDDNQLDGFESTLKKMLEADPQFISGRTLVYGIQAMAGMTVDNNEVLKQNIEQLAFDVETNSNCSKWEKLHVNALQALAMSNVDAAIQQWEEILVEFPSDILSLHSAGLTCLMSGRLERIGDISGRILPSFRDEYSLSTVHAWHSFGLSETNSYTQAERHARIGLSLEPRDGWSTHALAHVFEMTSRNDEGISYMRQCEPLWNFSNQIAGHNYWHWSLYYLTNGEFDAAVDVLETKLITRHGLDGLSLSYLLSMEDPSITNFVDNHRERIESIIEPHMAKHHRSFIDVH